MALEFNEGHQNWQLSLEDKDVINSLSEKKPESRFLRKSLSQVFAKSGNNPLP